MGDVTFSLDVHLVECLKEALPLSVFMETGTFKGDTIIKVEPFFERIITIEFSDSLWKAAAARFENTGNIDVLYGNSPDVLASVLPTLAGASILFWLDAHWCVADNTAGDKSQSPLLEEILAINSLGDTSVVLIDDARLFLAPPPEPHDITQWPTFDQILDALRSLSKQHEVMVINDVIAFYPKSINRRITSYARKYGVDWLRSRQSLVENDNLHVLLEEKHQALMQMTKICEEKEVENGNLRVALEEKHEALMQMIKSCEEKEVVIKALANEIQAFCRPAS